MACVRRYGPTHTLRLVMSPRLVLTADPALVPKVLGLRPDVATAGEENAVLKPLLGERSLLMLDGAEHQRLRRLLEPAFRGEAVRRQEPAIAELAEREVSRWPRGEPFALLPRMRELTLEVILRVVFGVEGGERLERLRRALTTLLGSGRTWMVVPALRRDLGPRSPWGRFVRQRAQVLQLLAEEVAQPSHGASLLAQLQQQPEAVPVQDLSDQLLTLLVAGHETTASSLAWCFALLLREPSLLAEVAEEARAGGRMLAEAVVRETLRHRPAFRIASRRLHRPWQLGSYQLPAGVGVGASIYALHHHPDVYRDPDVFRPSRFLDGAPDPRAWVPFGGGIRRCLGATFAQAEMVCVLQAVLRSVRLRAASPEPEPVGLRAVVLVPARGCRVVVARN
jgi:cytochrome P450